MGCSIVAVERQLTAVVKTKVAFAKIPDAQRVARAAVDGALPSLDAGPVGRPCTRFLTPAASALDMEIGTIVTRIFPAKGEVVPSDLPAGRAAHFRLKGPFDGMPGRPCSTGAPPKSSRSPASTGRSICRGKALILPSSRPISTRCSPERVSKFPLHSAPPTCWPRPSQRLSMKNGHARLRNRHDRTAAHCRRPNQGQDERTARGAADQPRQACRRAAVARGAAAGSYLHAVAAAG